MKTNRTWLLLLFLITAVLAILFFVHKPHAPSHPMAKAPPTIQGELVERTNVQASPDVHAGLPPASFQQATSTINRTASLPLEQLKSAVQQQNTPIRFYGRVVDQNENGIAGVHIIFHFRQLQVNGSGTIVTVFPKLDRMTDSNGEFAVDGASGDSLTMESVIKEGYRLSSKTQMTYGYGDVSQPHHPDSQNPVAIKMWKLEEAQQLVSHHLSRLGISVDGQPVQFDLFSGEKVSSGGQLIVRLNRNPQIISPRSHYDWSFELEIPSGGLVPTNDEFMYQAPEVGYQRTFRFDMPKDAGNWTTAINQQFYIELENGKYFGSLAVSLNTIHDTPPLGINLDIVINPSGIRSLQP